MPAPALLYFSRVIHCCCCFCCSLPSAAVLPASLLCPRMQLPMRRPSMHSLPTQTQQTSCMQSLHRRCATGQPWPGLWSAMRQMRRPWTAGPSRSCQPPSECCTRAGWHGCGCHVRLLQGLVLCVRVSICTDTYRCVRMCVWVWCVRGGGGDTLPGRLPSR